MTQPPLVTIKLTLLGIGGAFDADLGIPNTGALMEVFSNQTLDHRILIDCGHTCGRQLHQLNLTYNDIDTILITHAHGDHIDGLEVVGYKSRFLFKRNLKLIAMDDVLSQIWDSLKPKMGRLQLSSNHAIEATLSDYFAPCPLSPNPNGGATITLIPDLLSVSFVPVLHVFEMPAYGLMFNLGEDNPLIRWSGDTVFSPDSLLFEDFQGDRGDMIFHDCIFFPFYEETVHTHHSSLCTLPVEIRRRLVMVHHGRLEDDPGRDDEMILGLPLETFSWSFQRNARP